MGQDLRARLARTKRAVARRLAALTTDLQVREAVCGGTVCVCVCVGVDVLLCRGDGGWRGSCLGVCTFRGKGARLLLLDNVTWGWGGRVQCDDNEQDQMGGCWLQTCSRGAPVRGGGMTDPGHEDVGWAVGHGTRTGWNIEATKDVPYDANAVQVRSWQWCSSDVQAYESYCYDICGRAMPCSSPAGRQGKRSGPAAAGRGASSERCVPWTHGRAKGSLLLHPRH